MSNVDGRMRHHDNQGAKKPVFFLKNPTWRVFVGFIGFYWFFAGYFLFQCAVLDAIHIK